MNKSQRLLGLLEKTPSEMFLAQMKYIQDSGKKVIVTKTSTYGPSQFIYKSGANLVIYQQQGTFTMDRGRNIDLVVPLSKIKSL